MSAWLIFWIFWVSIDVRIVHFLKGGRTINRFKDLYSQEESLNNIVLKQSFIKFVLFSDRDLNV